MAKNNLMASRVNKTNATASVLEKKEQIKTKEGSAPKSEKHPKEKTRLLNRRDKTLYQVKEVQHREDDPDETAYSAALEAEAVSREQKAEKTAQAKKAAALWTKLLVLTLSLYVCFLIYGLLTTDYVYDAGGNVVPQVLSVEDLRVLNEYEKVTSYYLRARIIYEDTLKLDYSLAKNPDDSLIIAMSYTELLDDVDKLVVDLNAADFDTRYTAIYSQLSTWTTTDIAVYLQYMAKALTNNDATAASNAVVARDVVYNDFALVTSNIAKLSAGIRGVGDTDIFTWTPDSFLAELEEAEGKET